MAEATNEAILRGVASILQDASAALARLGMQAATQPQPVAAYEPQDKLGDVGLAEAAAALAQVATQFGGGGDAAAAVDPAAGAYVTGCEATAREPGDAALSTADFCAAHQLEPWIGEALELLAPEQRAAVMDPPLNTSHARNLNGIVVSRIKQVVPLDQRLGIFVEINGLSEGVVDRISTLTPEQAEAMMESGLKIQKASNPSGVAMRRISDVLRGARQVSGHGHAAAQAASAAPVAPWEASARQRQDRSRTPAPTGREAAQTAVNDTPEDVQQLMSSLGLEWWCGEVLKRLSLWQRQQVMKDVMNVQNARNPSGVVMSRVRQISETSELMSIFIDINQFESSVQAQLWALTPEQQTAVINPGIYLQNVRNPSTAVRSRIKNVLAGNDAFGKPL